MSSALNDMADPSNVQCDVLRHATGIQQIYMKYDLKLMQPVMM